MMRYLLFSSLCILPLQAMVMQTSPSNIIDKIIEKKKIEWANEQAGTLPAWRREFPTFYREAFPIFERMVQQHQLPTYDIAGPISYTMSLQEIKERIVALLQHLRKQGILITKEEFNRGYNPKQWLDRETNLTRVWGALYLAYHFKKNNITLYKVPQYLIVVNDLNAIQVEIKEGTCFPVLSTLKTGNIYAQKIDGKPAARRLQTLSDLGFTDFSDPGNILQTADGTYYIVDTEYKSFYDGSPQSKLFANIEGRILLCEYLNDRFKLLNPGITLPLTLKFSLKTGPPEWGKGKLASLFQLMQREWKKP